MNRQKERSFRASIARVVAGHDFDVVAKTSASVVPAVVEVPTVETIAVPMNTVREAAMQIMTKRDGYTPEEAAQIYEVYAWGQTRGGAQEAQGIVNKVIAPMPKNPNAKDIAVEQHMPGVIKVDGGQNHAVVVMNQAMEKTMEMANTQGIAMAGINNVSTSTGANGYFAKEMAKHGYIGIVFSGPAKQFVAPFGSSEAVFSTNPISIGFPGNESPMTIDMTTAKRALYDFVKAQRAGTSVPENVGWTKDGRRTTDPGEILQGSVDAWGDQRGSAMAAFVERITGSLVGAAEAGIGDPTNWGNTIIVINPEAFGWTKEAYATSGDQFVEQVRRARPAPGVDRVRVPGERGDEHEKMVQQSGEITIPTSLYQQFMEVAGQYQ